MQIHKSFGDKGPAQGREEFSTASTSHAYSSRIVNCRDKGTLFQYDAPSHVWKQQLSMSNMCRPLNPRRSFAEVLKTCSSKYENTSSLLPSTCKSKISISLKRYIQQAVDKLTSFEQGKSPCVHKGVYKGQTVDPVPCFNRFDPLKQFDTQELVDQTENSTVGHTGHKANLRSN